MTAGAFILSVDPNVVTTAFVTKTIFTLVDERIKKKNGENSNTNNQNKTLF
jgi:6-phosphogluconolactonase/glucosamine-6-phosphate isomerase/deaminase